MSDRVSYKEYKEKQRERQENMSKDEIAELMSKRSEFSLDLDNLKPQAHNWTDRGLKYTCENAGHAYHEAYKIRKPMTKQ